MLICGFKLDKGEKKTVQLPVPDGGEITATLFRGIKEGKTLVITAGVHGSEYNGIETLRALCRELDPKKLHGQVILIPLINTGGFYAGVKRIIPDDGVNLNLAFPGNPSGTLSARIAATIEKYIYPEADFIADLHGGDSHEMAMPFVYFPDTARSEVRAASVAAAQALSLSYRVASPARAGLYSWAAQQGIPALLLERGGQGLWSLDDIAAYRRNVYELLNHLQILPQLFPISLQQEITHTEYIEPEKPGFWYPHIREGQTFLKGALLGELRDFDDNLIEAYSADFNGVLLYYTVALGVQKGDILLAYGKL